MKATELLEKIRENLKDYPIDYLKRKATDDRYPDSITKRLAIYNSSIYDEIYEKNIEDDYEIKLYFTAYLWWMAAGSGLCHDGRLHGASGQGP